MTERWLPVVGWEGLYEVSDHGRVRGVDRVLVRKNGVIHTEKARVRRQGELKHGYRNVSFSRPGQSTRTHLVHRLVLAAFVGPPPVGMESLHWDDDHSNNHLSNLRYGTRSDNMRDCVRNGHNRFASRDACASGHDFTPENTFRRSNGGRGCRECNRKWQRDYDRRRRQKVDVLESDGDVK